MFLQAIKETQVADQKIKRVGQKGGDPESTTASEGEKDFD